MTSRLSPFILPLFALTLGAALGCAEPAQDEGETGAEAELPALGDTPLPACEAARFAHDQLLAELALPDPDPEYIAELYRGADTDLSGESPLPGGSPLQRWVREVGARLGRVEQGLLVDDAAIEAAIEAAPAIEDPLERRLTLLTIRDTFRLVASLDLRSRLAGVADVLPDPARDPGLLHAEWDAAYCVWEGMLRPLALDADADTNADAAAPSVLGGWELLIVDAFTSGHAGIIGPDQPWAPDEFATKPAKQIIEKTTFATIHRVLLQRAAQAQQSGDTDAGAEAAAEALGLFALIEDRVLGRNTPAVESITAMLGADPGAIDPALVEDELALAFVKRARKYCDEAVLAGSLGTPDAIKGTWEGIVYTAVVLPAMAARLPDFDADAHMTRWQDYLDAVTADDANAALEISAELVEVNCALQVELGIASCTATEDESE